MSYRHFSIEEREMILKYRTLKLSINKIANILNRNKGSVSRELKRNSINGEYSPFKAQENYKQNKQRCGRKNKLLTNTNLKIAVLHALEEDWSPEQIHGRLKMENSFKISFKTIYRAIENGVLNVIAKQVLRRKGKSRKHGTTETRGKIKNRKMIEERPIEANDRLTIGHFESDTVIGGGKKGAIATYVDRKSRYLIAGIMPNRKAITFNKKTIDIFKDIPSSAIKTFTSDNGKEFSKFEDLEKTLEVITYFANPYHSWERGTNENTNGLLRQYFPKKSDFSLISENILQEAVNKINSRPRKILGYLTASEVFWSEVKRCT